MKYRIRITQIVTIILLIIAKPYSWKLFFPGLALIISGELFRIWANGYLKKDKTLATEGPFSIVRNPLYAGSFTMALGFAIICINFGYPYRTLALLAIIFIGFKYVYACQVKAEEKHLQDIFGQEYLSYKTKVNRYIPNLKLLPQALKQKGFSIRQVRKNGEFITIGGVILVVILLAVKLHFSL